MNGQVDLFQLAAEARPLLAQLHQRDDVIVQFRSDDSDFQEDRLSDQDRSESDHPGKFALSNKFITLNLDALISERRPMPESLATLDDFRKSPVLAGVAAHASAHARFSIWDQDPSKVPSVLPNPDHNPDHPVPTKDFSIEEDDGSITVEQHEDPDYTGPATFPVSNTGRLMEVAGMLEEARVERLGMKTFGKTFREALKFSSTHLTLESLDESDDLQESSLDAALRTMILIGGRTVAGTLGFDARNRQATQKVLGNAQKVIETALADQIADGADPFFEAMSIISDAVFDNTHTDPIPHLEFARKILEIIHPEDKENPDNPGESGQGQGEGEGQGQGGAGMALGKGQAPGEGGEGDEDVSGNSGKALSEAEGDLKEALGELAAEMASEIEKEEQKVERELDEDGGGGFGAVRSLNEKPPHIDRYEQPGRDDRELAKRAEKWMRDQIEPTITEFERGQWMPGGSTRFNSRNWVRDNLAGRQANERTDWDKRSELIKPAPPVKVGIMLDGSGSMMSKARESAGIAWAIANAAAMLPESRTASLVFGHEALLTQAAGHGVIPKEVAVAKNNAGWENFIAGAKMMEEELQITDESMDDGNPSNVLIIVVSDLMFGGSGQGAGFTRITKRWKDRGFRTLVVGAHPAREGQIAPHGAERTSVELSTVKDLFK